MICRACGHGANVSDFEVEDTDDDEDGGDDEVPLCQACQGHLNEDLECESCDAEANREDAADQLMEMER